MRPHLSVAPAKAGVQYPQDQRLPAIGRPPVASPARRILGPGLRRDDDEFQTVESKPGKQKGEPNGSPFHLTGKSRTQIDSLIQSDRRPLGIAPTCMEVGSPFLNMMRVGIDRTPYFTAVCGFSSILSLAIFTLPPISVAISSSAGPIIR